MIQVDRGQEPAELAHVRAEKLAELRVIASTRPPLGNEIRGYGVVKGALWRRQGYKCAYCECREQEKRNDVEHWRPKGRADRAPGSSETHGYWWLAYAWDNLLFACRNCNQSGAKLDRFPLDEGSLALQPEEDPPGQELPLLIDPATESGADHIVFVPFEVNGEERWMPVPRDGSAKGRFTIEVCALDRPDLLDLYQAYVAREIEPRIARVLGAIPLDQPDAASAAWDEALNVLLAPGQEHVGLARDVLDSRVPPNMRRELCLREPPRR